MIRIGVLLECRGLGLWGSGTETPEADVTTFKIIVAGGKKIPVIPGSYVKGLLRTWSYRIARWVSHNSPAPLSCSRMNPCRECIVCRVFGCPGHPPSKIVVSSFYPVRESSKAPALWERGLQESLVAPEEWIGGPRTELVTRVGIRDSTGTRSEGRLFTVEHVSPGALFYGEILLQKEQLGEQSEEALRMILLALSQLNYTYAGRRSRVKVHIIGINPEPQDDVSSLIVKKLLFKPEVTST